jgi:hypothetical protein
MPATPTSQRMGELHEIHLAEVFAATKTKSSGNQWSDPMDTKNHADLPWPFRVDGKSTKSKQIPVSLGMIAKAREQAGTRMPALGLRWYGNETLTSVLEEWSAVPDDIMTGLLADARETASLREQLKRAREHEQVSAEHIESLRQERDKLRAALEAATELPWAAQDRREACLPEVPQYVPELPWTVVTVSLRPGGKSDRAGMRYLADGQLVQFEVETVLVERSIGSGNRPRLIVNERLVERGDLYQDGILRVRVWPDYPDREVG